MENMHLLQSAKHRGKFSVSFLSDIVIPQAFIVSEMSVQNNQSGPTAASKENEGVVRSSRVEKKASETKSRSRITTHVLDTSRGSPAVNLPVSLYKFANEKWIFLKESNTTTNGRCEDLVENNEYESGRYKILFKVEKYFKELNTETMYPTIEIVLETKNVDDHYHIPLLLSPFGFTTYRGS